MLEETVDERYELVKLVKLIVLVNEPLLGKAFGQGRNKWRNCRPAKLCFVPLMLVTGKVGRIITT